jgi:hypothetical protein
VQVIQGGAVLATSVLVQLAGRQNLHLVVGLWSVAGVVLMLFLAGRWPKSEAFTEAIATAEAVNRAEPAPEATHPVAPAPVRANASEPDLPAPARRAASGRAAPATDPPTA